MFLIDSTMRIRNPAGNTMVISQLADSTIINPPELGEEWKLLAPRSRVHIVDRNTMMVLETLTVNYTDCEPFDIYPHLAGERRIAIVEQHNNDNRYLINAFNHHKLNIYELGQYYKIRKGKLIINDFIVRMDNKDYSLERIKLNSLSVDIVLNNGNKRTTTRSWSIEKSLQDNNPLVKGLKRINDFGEIRFMGMDRVIYQTNIRHHRYTIALDVETCASNPLHKVIDDLEVTLNTIGEIERLQSIMATKGLGFADLSESLFTMGFPNLAVMALTSRLHYETDIEKMPAKPSEVLLVKLRSNGVLGRHLSKSLTRKVYTLVRRLRINYLEGLKK